MNNVKVLRIFSGEHCNLGQIFRAAISMGLVAVFTESGKTLWVGRYRDTLSEPMDTLPDEVKNFMLTSW